MDAIRQIRFVYPPLVFASAVGIAMWIDPGYKIENIPKEFTENAATAIAAFVVGSGALLACGYVIGSIPIFLLRAGACIMGMRHYESLVKQALHEDAWKRLGGKRGQIQCDDRAYLAAAFNHGVVSDRLYGWLERRWNAFNIAMHTATALVIALIVVHSNSIAAGSTWNKYMVALTVMFAFLALYTWFDVRAMTSLLVRTSNKGDDSTRTG